MGLRFYIMGSIIEQYKSQINCEFLEGNGTVFIIVFSCYHCDHS